jgi:kumamolisin
MKTAKLFAPVSTLLLVFSLTLSAAAEHNHWHTVVVPKSSIEQPGDIGVRAHTNIKLLMPDTGKPMAGPPFAGYGYETPASLACVYNLVDRTPRGCNPNEVTANPTGGKGAIAIVDAFDDPNAQADLQAFSAQFGLESPNFTVVYASGTEPQPDPTGGWELEESLDIEWAHAMAPDAKLYLVEAADNSFVNLLTAEVVAAQLVAKAGGGEVSNSWGGSEFSQESQLDQYFVYPKVVFLASSGDDPGTIYPSTSPNVIAAGGTTTARNPNTGDFLYELPWDLAGGGVSQYEPRPKYQNGIARIVGAYRGVPDLSFDSNPVTGVWVLDTYPYEGETGWWIVGGTSVASPSLAGILNSTGQIHKSTQDELSEIYSNLGAPYAFNDIRLGVCGPYSGFVATWGWDPCTGVGSVNGKFGK